MSCPGQKWQKTVKKGLKTNEIPIKKVRKNAQMGVFISLEQVTGLEPVISAWKANVLPLHYTRILCRNSERLERETGLEPATSALARRRSTK